MTSGQDGFIQKEKRETRKRGVTKGHLPRRLNFKKNCKKKSYKKSWSDELIWLGVICRGSCFLSHSRSVRIQWGWEQILHSIRTVYRRQLCRYVHRAWSCRGWQYAWMSTLLLSRRWHLFRCKFRESNAEVLILVCTNQRFQTWSTASWPFRSVEAITMARVQAQHGPDKASALSIILARHWASKSCCQFTKFRIACCLGFATCSCSLLFLCSLLLTLALLFGVMIRTSSEVPQTCPPFRSLASLSLCIRLDVYDQYWQLSVSVSVLVHASVFTEGLCAHVKATVWSYQVVTWRIPILRFEQHCSTEVSGFLATFVATSSSRTCSCIQKVWHIFAFTLPSCFQLIRHRILRFSSIQYRPALNRRFRFRSVIPNLCHRISYGMLHWDKYEFTSLAHWLDNRPNVALLQQNPTYLGPTNLHLVASILLRIKLRRLKDSWLSTDSVYSWYKLHSCGTSMFHVSLFLHKCRCSQYTPVVGRWGRGKVRIGHRISVSTRVPRVISIIHRALQHFIERDKERTVNIMKLIEVEFRQNIKEKNVKKRKKKKEKQKRKRW